MKIVIVGDGKVGYTLAEQLSHEGHDIVVIDNDPDALTNPENNLDVMGVTGNGAVYAVQIEAGVDKSDLLIAATSSDEINMLCCLLAKRLGAKQTIARIRNPEYTVELKFLQEDLALSMVINPELAAAMEISRILRFPAANKVETFAKGRVELVEFKISEQSELDGLYLRELHSRYKVKVLICAVNRKDEVFIPGGDFLLQAGDKVYITSKLGNTTEFFKAAGIVKHKINSVMIVGGSRIAYYLTKIVSGMGMHVKIIESDLDRCTFLSEALPGADIIHGNGTNQRLLLEEGLCQADAFVALTGFDEENIILAMYANTKNVNKIVTKINQLSFSELLYSHGVDSIVSPKLITADHIVGYVRALQNSMGSNVVETMYKLVGGEVEALEFKINNSNPHLGIPLKNVELKKDVLIASIVRAGNIIIPDGNSTVEKDDSVIVVAKSSRLNDLNDIFK